MPQCILVKDFMTAHISLLAMLCFILLNVLTRSDYISVIIQIMTVCLISEHRADLYPRILLIEFVFNRQLNR